MSGRTAKLALLVVLALPAPALSQALRVAVTRGKIGLDGRLDESAWAGADVGSRPGGFVQPAV